MTTEDKPTEPNETQDSKNVKPWQTVEQPRKWKIPEINKHFKKQSGFWSHMENCGPQRRHHPTQAIFAEWERAFDIVFA